MTGLVRWLSERPASHRWTTRQLLLRPRLDVVDFLQIDGSPAAISVERGELPWEAAQLAWGHQHATVKPTGVWLSALIQLDRTPTGGDAVKVQADIRFNFDADPVGYAGPAHLGPDDLRHHVARFRLDSSKLPGWIRDRLAGVASTELVPDDDDLLAPMRSLVRQHFVDALPEEAVSDFAGARDRLAAWARGYPADTPWSQRLLVITPQADGVAYRLKDFDAGLDTVLRDVTDVLPHDQAADARALQTAIATEYGAPLAVALYLSSPEPGDHSAKTEYDDRPERFYGAPRLTPQGARDHLDRFPRRPDAVPAWLRSLAASDGDGDGDGD